VGQRGGRKRGKSERASGSTGRGKENRKAVCRSSPNCARAASYGGEVRRNCCGYVRERGKEREDPGRASANGTALCGDRRDAFPPGRGNGERRTGVRGGGEGRAGAVEVVPVTGRVCRKGGGLSEAPDTEEVG